jgi:plastocyanin
MIGLNPVALSRILIPLAACLLLLAAACSSDDNGGDNGDTGTPTDAPSNGLSAQPDSPQAINDEVTEAADGALATTTTDNSFTLNNLKVPLNETTTISVTNDGIAIHNMRIAGPDGEWSTGDDTVSDPALIAGGETAVVEFTPTIAGTYTFRCDFHPLEQGGVIVVE